MAISIKRFADDIEARLDRKRYRWVWMVPSPQGDALWVFISKEDTPYTTRLDFPIPDAEGYERRLKRAVRWIKEAYDRED